jgi:hypothetical protein
LKPLGGEAGFDRLEEGADSPHQLADGYVDHPFVDMAGECERDFAIARSFVTSRS